MDFKDWRKSAQQPTEEAAATSHPSRNKASTHYIEEQIREAQARGAFDNLPGAGQPLKLESNPYAGEKALGYSLLKNNGYAPAEIELAKEIRQELARLDAQRVTLAQRGRALRRRRIAPFASEKHAYNTAVTNALTTYENQLRELNRKILTLNLTAPPPMHRSALNVEQSVSEFRAACPLLV